MKWVSERTRADTPAMRLGILKHRVGVKALLLERLFVERVGLPKRWQEYYWGKTVTRLMPQGEEHQRRHAA